MDLKIYFTALCRQLSAVLKTPSPTIKTMVSGKDGKNKTGTVARYGFNGFNMDIYYMESLRGRGTQQVIWLSFFFDKEPSVTFSLYDILTLTEPDNFRCYTYSYVDSQELMKACFEEITELLQRLIPDLIQISENGVDKNKLLLAQKQKINEYFGNNIAEASNLLSAGDKLLQMMYLNFFRNQIDTFIIGAPSVFFSGNEEKALKLLKKSKYRSLYEDNLLKYLEDNKKAPELSETAKQASSEKGAERHNHGTKGSLKILGLGLGFAIPIAAAFSLVFILAISLLFKDNIYILGIRESLIMMPFYALLPSFIIATKLITGGSKGNNKRIVSPTASETQKKIFKYGTILTETIIVLFLFTSVNSTTVFYDNAFSYSTETLPLSQEICEYDSIEFAAVIDGYNYKGQFFEDKHIAIHTKSGTTIDLYNSTFFSAEKFKKDISPFFEEKGIPTKHYKTTDDIK